MTAKMKNYATLVVSISKDHENFQRHAFPFSSQEKANAAFDSWVAKAKEKLGDRIDSFSDCSNDSKKSAFMIVDGKWIDITIENEEWRDDTITLDEDTNLDI